MGIIFNSKNVTAVKFNNINCTKVYFNDVKVFPDESYDGSNFYEPLQSGFKILTTSPWTDLTSGQMIYSPGPQSYTGSSSGDLYNLWGSIDTIDYSKYSSLYIKARIKNDRSEYVWFKISLHYGSSRTIPDWLTSRIGMTNEFTNPDQTIETTFDISNITNTDRYFTIAAYVSLSSTVTATIEFYILSINFK